MNDRKMSWREYFAELVRVAIDKGYAEDYDLFDMGMDKENVDWDSYLNERDSAFYTIFHEEF